jgi:DNA-directed RNA polymerase subunit RPC12/RpoP
MDTTPVIADTRPSSDDVLKTSSLSTDRSTMGNLPVQGTATQPLTCIECGRRWLLAYEVWRMYLTDDSPADAAIYCPDCAHREFDP